MSARRAALVLFVIAVLVVLAATLGRGRTSVVTADVPSEPHGATSGANQAAAPASPSPTPPSPSAAGDRTSDTPDAPTAKPGPRIRPGDNYAGKDEPFLDEEQLDALLASNSVEDLYAALTPDHRRDLVGLLADRGLLRDAMPALLRLEQDSDMRANLIASTIPRGTFPDDEEAADPSSPPSDPDLVDVLDDLPEDAGDLEIRTRLDVAMLADEVAALPLVREVLAKSGDSAARRLRAQELLLKLSAGGAPVTAEEVAAAQEHLYGALSGPGALAIYEPEERIRGYMALAAATDRERTMRFYEDAMARETDARARTVLQGLLRTW